MVSVGRRWWVTSGARLRSPFSVLSCRCGVVKEAYGGGSTISSSSCIPSRDALTGDAGLEL